jgi:hypothetical protein
MKDWYSKKHPVYVEDEFVGGHLLPPTWIKKREEIVMPKKKKVPMKRIRVAKGVTVKRGEEEKMREKKGSSSSGKYKNVPPKQFAGKSGGASKYSFPINTLKRARNALARAHYAPNPEGIRAAVYRKYPELKMRHEMRQSKRKER